MKGLVASFDSINWNDSVDGLREKKIEIGRKAIRLVEIDSRYVQPDWCRTGHVGFVVEGSLVMNIDGERHAVAESDIFVFEDEIPEHRHIPIVPKGDRVVLLLIEDRGA